MRERLIGLIQEAFMQPKYEFYTGGRNCAKGYVSAKTIADYLLENGVIVPPCKVGDYVYKIHNNDWKQFFRGEGRELEIIKSVFTYKDIPCIGTLVFLTKEEAEGKSAELEGDKE